MKGLLKVFSAAMVLGALVAGCGSGGGGGAESTASGVVTRPEVIYTTPANNDTGVGTNSKITATFSEAMDSSTITTGSFLLIDKTTNSQVSPTVVSYDSTNRIATLSLPLSLPPLAGSRQYVAVITTDVRNHAGNRMAADYVWSFTTAAGSNITPPTMTSKAPADGATGVGINTSVAMSFSKPMDISTFSKAFSLKPKTGLIPITGTFSLIGQVVVFTPDTTSFPIITGTTYTATLTTEAKDLTGIPMASPVSWEFTTGTGVDGTAPSVLGVSPAAGAPNVPTSGTSISVTFDEAIYPDILGSINGIATKIVVDYATNMVTMTPTAPLTANKDYTFRIRVRDLSGNQMPNIYEWTFTTGN